MDGILGVCKRGDRVASFYNIPEELLLQSYNPMRYVSVTFDRGIGGTVTFSKHPHVPPQSVIHVHSYLQSHANKPWVTQFAGSIGVKPNSIGFP